MQEQISLPKIDFSVSENEISESPKLGAIALKEMVNQLNLNEIVSELEIKKHHGVNIEDIIFVLLLYSSYGVTSIKELAQKDSKDPALKSIIDDINKINNKVILYFQNNLDISAYEKLLDNVLSSSLNKGRFKSAKNGILIVDDSPLIKTGKKMDKIEIIFDHVDKRYVLGYVLVATSYADENKSYCVNFQLRLSTEEDRKKAEEKKLKKKNEIDLRKKGSLLNWVNIQINKGLEVKLTNVSGINLNAETLQGLDNMNVGWIGLPNNKTPLFDHKSNKYDFEVLKQQTVKNKPTIVELSGFQAYMKQVYFKEYGKVIICIIKNFHGNELETFLLKKQEKHIMISNVQEYFIRQQPADNNKLNIALNLFKRAKNQGIKSNTACADSWFFVAWFVKALLSLEGINRFISKIKSNTEVEYKGKAIKVQDLWEQISLKDILGRSIKACAILVTIKGFEKPVKLVFVQEIDKNGLQKARYILVCTDISFSKEKIIKAYKLRWHIECFFRTAKQTFFCYGNYVKRIRHIF